MRYGSVCSGIEAATVAWHPLGWKPAFFSEIDPFPSAVLAHHYPEVKNYGDFTKLIDPAHHVHGEQPIDLLVGGTPCQAFSVAGLRQGLADPRGGLTLEFLRLARALRPRWIVWENVPGVLSQDGGRAFGAFIGGLEDLGYGWAYRVLDAQYTRVDGYPGAVPQRRRRVFVVGCAGGDFARAAAVLLEPEGVRRDSAPRRASRKGVASDAERRPVGIDGYNHQVTGDITVALGTKSDHMRSLVSDVAGSLDTQCGGGKLTHQSATNGHLIIRPTFWNGADVAETLTCTSDDQRLPDKNRMQMVVHPVGFDTYNHAVSDVCQTIKSPAGGANESVGTVMQAMAVRRLTPVECERLQGFPDDYTRIAWKKKSAEECPDGGRYKALGNSMAVNVMRWIGRRIELVEKA